MPSEMTSGMVAMMSKNFRMPEGATDSTRSVSRNGAVGAHRDSSLRRDGRTGGPSHLACRPSEKLPGARGCLCRVARTRTIRHIVDAGPAGPRQAVPRRRRDAACLARQAWPGMLGPACLSSHGQQREIRRWLDQMLDQMLDPTLDPMLDPTLDPMLDPSPRLMLPRAPRTRQLAPSRLPAS